MSLSKQPLELYTFATTQELSKSQWSEVIANEYCPYINARCIKNRKSDGDRMTPVKSLMTKEHEEIAPRLQEVQDNIGRVWFALAHCCPPDAPVMLEISKLCESRAGLRSALGEEFAEQTAAPTPY